MMSKLYHALLAANVPEEKAREAAEEAAELEISKIGDLATKADIAMGKGGIEAAKSEIGFGLIFIFPRAAMNSLV
jgi:hypothetical protein